MPFAIYTLGGGVLAEYAFIIVVSVLFNKSCHYDFWPFHEMLLEEALKFRNLIRKFDFNIDFSWYANSCNLPENTVIRADIQYTLVNAHFPRFPVASAAAPVHAVAAWRLHDRYAQLFCRKRDRTGNAYTELLRDILNFYADVIELLRIFPSKFDSCRVHSS
jgi:hypothetical protein